MDHRNFYGSDGKYYMVYCDECKRENYAMMVSDGKCAWCGYEAERIEDET